MQNDVTLAYASQYAEKYYFNEELGTLPEEVKKEVLVLLIHLTEEAGGVAQFVFDPEGLIHVESWCEEGDLGYDHISAGLLIKEIEVHHQDLLEELELWYRTTQARKKAAAHD